MLLQKISSLPHQVVSFDKSLNNSVQKVQIDLLIRCWDNDSDRLCTRYMGSEFMGCSTADDVLEAFQNGISEIDESKVMQFSSDGPNAKLAFLKKYASMWEENELDSLRDLGTCGLHVIHGSMKAGAKVKLVLISTLYKYTFSAVYFFLKV